MTIQNRNQILVDNSNTVSKHCSQYSQILIRMSSCEDIMETLTTE